MWSSLNICDVPKNSLSSIFINDVDIRKEADKDVKVTEPHTFSLETSCCDALFSSCYVYIVCEGNQKHMEAMPTYMVS